MANTTITRGNLTLLTGTAQAFCTDCVPGNHAHMDAYGRPEYHCPSSRTWVGWQRVYFNRAGRPICSCEHGQVMAAKGMPARCVGHALYVWLKIERGEWAYLEEGDRPFPLIISVSGGELFDDEQPSTAQARPSFTAVACELSRIFDLAA